MLSIDAILGFKVVLAGVEVKKTIKLIRTIEQINARIVALLLALLALTVCWQVISRYLLSSPSTATDEIARLLFIWLGLLSSAYAFARNRHIAIDILPKLLPLFWQNLLKKLTIFLVALFASSILVFGGSGLMMHVTEMGQVTPALELPVALMYLALPVSGFLILIYCAGLLLSQPEGAGE